MTSQYYQCLAVALMYLMVELSADVNVNIKIDIHPKVIGIGDTLTVKCSLYNIPNEERDISTNLQCPFIGSKNDDCFLNCNNVCRTVDCKGINKLVNGFKCDENFSSSLTVFTYTMPSISKELINNRKLLSFSCKWKDKEVFTNVTVEDRKETPKLPNKNDITDTTQRTLTATTRNQGSPFKLGTQDVVIIILVVLIALLITSFLINVWCCFQFCLIRSKHNKKKREKNERSNSLHYFPQPSTMLLQNYDNTYQEVRRAKSQPTLANNGRSTPAKMSSTNFQRVNTNSLENNSKYRGSTYNNSVNELYNNYQIQENPNPACYQGLIGIYAPPYFQLPQHHMRDNMSHSQSEDLDTCLDNDSADHIHSSKLQPLPSQPDNNSSFIESGSSHIV